MKFRVILLFLCCQYLSYAQEEYPISKYWNQDKKEAMIGVKNCYVRSAPNSSGKLLDSLQMGNKVQIVSQTEALLKIKGIYTNWTEIEYTKNNADVKRGFIWSGFLALNYVQDKEGTFVTSISKISKRLNKDNYEETLFHIAVYVLGNKNTILAEKVIEKNIMDSSFFQDKTIGSLGLSGLNTIYRISFLGEACGVPSFYFYFGWNGKELLVLPEKMEVGDAGVFYHSESFYFQKKPEEDRI